MTRAGIYDLPGTVRLHPVDPGPIDSHNVSAGQFTMTVSSSSGGFSYKMDAPAGFLPGGLTSLVYGPSSNANEQPYDASRNLRSYLAYDPGYSYVSMGEWEWYFVHLDGGTAGGFGALFFAAGDRTPDSGIPVSGTATYDAHTFRSLASDLTPGIPFTLTADFGARLISTRIDQDYRYNPQGDVLDYPAPGIHVAGSAPFSNSGSFDIPLAGTVNYSGAYPLNTAQTPPTQPVTGTMDGAFFGPHAEQVGGTFSLQNSGGAALLQDAFVGKRP